MRAEFTEEQRSEVVRLSQSFLPPLRRRVDEHGLCRQQPRPCILHHRRRCFFDEAMPSSTAQCWLLRIFCYDFMSRREDLKGYLPTNVFYQFCCDSFKWWQKPKWWRSHGHNKLIHAFSSYKKRLIRNDNLNFGPIETQVVQSYFPEEKRTPQNTSKMA